jgi:hypothetical protein
MLKFAATAILVLTAVGLASAQGKNAAEIRRIDTLARTIDRIAKNDRKKIIIADTADFDQKKADWKLFESEKALDAFREKTETYTVAFNWLRNGKVIASNFTLFSPSGDWTKYVFHYFRPDGSLAMVKSELRTFFGEYIVREERYFDKRGRILKRSIRYLDLTTGKPKKPTKEMRDDNPSLYKVDYYLNVKKLPFVALLSRAN